MVIPSTLEARRKENRKIDIVAHRGFWNCEEAGYAKNSIAALRCAQEAGFWGSEFDVNITADSVLIVYHDGEINGKKIEEHPYSEFKDYKIANGEVIPTIDMFLEQGKKYSETMLVYELKPHSCAEVEDRFVELAIENLKQHGLYDPERVMFISFSLYMCEKIAKEHPQFTVQFLGAGHNPEELAERGINGVDYNHLLFKVNRKWYKMARKNNMSVNAWTVNKTGDMKSMLKMGVDQLTTDNPLEARALMEEMKVTELK
jgi:glycerophosphoryl diester phosphodiesterase